MAIQLGSAFGKVELDASGLQRGVTTAVGGLKTLGETARTMNDKLNTFATGMQKVGAAMTLAFTLPILAFGKMAVTEAAQSEAVIADLNTVIESTGGIAGVTSQSVQDYADKMQLLTKFSDDQIISGNAMLLTFTNIGKDVFPLASDATLDLAQKFGMDLSQASIILGKALNDPIQGVTALRRIGVQLTDEQEKSVKAFMDVNDIASAQKIILGELETEVGGVAEAFGKTFAGQVDIFNHRVDDLKEKIGMQLIPALIRLMDSAQPILDWFTNASPATIDFIIALAGIIAISGPLSTAIGTIGKVFLFFSAGGGGASVVTFITATLIPALGSLFTFITATAIPAIVSVGTAIWGALLPLLPIIALIAAVVLLVYLVWKNWDQLKIIVSQLAFIIKHELKGALENVKKAASDFSNEWKKSMETWKSNFQQAQEINQKAHEIVINAMIDGISSFIKRIEDIKSAFQGLFDALTKDGYGFTTLFEDGSGALLNLATAFGIPEKAAQDFLTDVFSVIDNMDKGWRELTFNIWSYFDLHFKEIQAIFENFIKTFQTKLTEIKNWATNTWNQIASAFTTAWSTISNFFETVKNSIISGIQSIIQAVDDLISSLADIVLPDDLMPGSPTPFEMGLRGIANAMSQLSRDSIPELNRSFALAQAARSPAYAQAGMGGSMISQTLNFSDGLTERRAYEMIDGRIDAAFERMTRMLGGA